MSDPSRILITAFEPFASPGKPMRDANASQEVLEAFVTRYPDRCDHVVLPVNTACEEQLHYAKEGGPAGISSMGEADREGDWHTNAEPLAWDRAVQTGTPEDDASSMRSAFVEGLPLTEGMESEERIGSYWCNRVYYLDLQWSNGRGHPVVFLHLRVHGSRERQLEHLEHVVAHMERVLAEQGTAEG
ncbi:MAG: C15 family peptidase [Planctomycetota bacterium]|jgi:hypothetical protein